MQESLIYLGTIGESGHIFAELHFEGRRESIMLDADDVQKNELAWGNLEKIILSIDQNKFPKIANGWLSYSFWNLEPLSEQEFSWVAGIIQTMNK